MTTEHAAEVARGDRFAFGRNWSDFLNSVDDSRVETAVASLRSRLGDNRLDGLTFLDAGSGSGLFSLAARMLGARVHSFDYDPQSVACTEELKRRFIPEDEGWSIELGSVLDRAYVDSLGRFDITSSWDVLHHTGSMWEALDSVCCTVAVGVACSSRSTMTRAARVVVADAQGVLQPGQPTVPAVDRPGAIPLLAPSVGCHIACAPTESVDRARLAATLA